MFMEIILSAHISRLFHNGILDFKMAPTTNPSERTFSKHESLASQSS
jgi:hypothetical protein